MENTKKNPKNHSLFKTTESGELLIKKALGYYSVGGGKVPHPRLVYGKLTNQTYVGLLKILDDMGLDYMIKGYNEYEVVTANVKGILRIDGPNKFNTSFCGWTRGLNSHIVKEVYLDVCRLQHYTVWDWHTFYRFIGIALENILRKEDLPKATKKKYKSKGNYDPRKLGEIKLFTGFIQDFIKLLGPEGDQDILSNILERYDYDKLIEYVDLYNSDIDKFNEKISCIYNENNYKILKSFTL